METAIFILTAAAVYWLLSYESRRELRTMRRIMWHGRNARMKRKINSAIEKCPWAEQRICYVTVGEESPKVEWHVIPVQKNICNNPDPFVADSEECAKYYKFGCIDCKYNGNVRPITGTFTLR